MDFSLGDDEYKGIQVLIPEAEYELVEKMWIKALEKGTKSNVAEAHDGEYTIFGAYLKALGEDPVNIYSQIIPADSTVKLNSCIELKRNVFLTEDLYESEFNLFSDYLKEFAKEIYLDVVSEQVKAEEDVLKDLNKELKNLQNEKEAINKGISENEHEVEVSEDKIDILSADIAVKNEEIAREKVNLSAAGDPVQEAAIKEILKKAENGKKKLQKDLKKEKKKIVGYESDIDKALLEIPSMNAQLVSKREEIEIQSNILLQVELKQESIKNY